MSRDTTTSTVPKTSEGPVPTRLPDYFPTYVKECKEPANTFFRCFEEAAAMKHPTDTTSAPAAIGLCQSELSGYTQCMGKHLKREGKEWWKIW